MYCGCDGCSSFLCVVLQGRNVSQEGNKVGMVYTAVNRCTTTVCSFWRAYRLRLNMASNSWTRRSLFASFSSTKPLQTFLVRIEYGLTIRLTAVHTDKTTSQSLQLHRGMMDSRWLGLSSFTTSVSFQKEVRIFLSPKTSEPSACSGHLLPLKN